jgi:hypothetical protein
MFIPEAIKEAVRLRAKARCEYCRFPFGITRERFHTDHVVARQHGGATVLHNLAFTCSRCNLHKGPNLTGIDPHTGLITRLFNPRRDAWATHLGWHAALLIAKTDVGRATIATLNMNDPDRAIHRSLLIELGLLQTDETARPPGEDVC